MIDARVELVPILLLGRIGDEVVRQPRPRRQRVSIDQLGGHGIEPVGQYEVRRKTVADESCGVVRICARRQWIVDDAWQLAEVPGAHFCGRHRVDKGPRQALAEAIVIAEEKCLVATDRAAQREAKLVLLEGGDLVGRPVEEVLRVQSRVSQKLIDRAVDLVGPRFGDDIDLAAGITSLLGRVEIGLDLELLDRLYRRADHQGESEPVVIIDPVIQVVVGAFAVAVDEQLAARPLVVGACSAHDGTARAVAGPANPGA